MPKSIKVAIMTQTQGAHLPDYFGSLAKIEEADAVALSDPSEESVAAARKTLGDKLKEVHKSPAELLKSFKPHMAIVLSLVDKTNGEVRSRVTPDVALPRSLRKAIAD